MLRDSMEHAQEDMEARRLREQQVEADRVIEALEAALQEDGEALLDSEELERVMSALSSLKDTARNDDHLAIKRAVESLEKTCEFYVERRMNQSVSRAMSGHNIEEF